MIQRAFLKGNTMHTQCHLFSNFGANSVEFRCYLSQILNNNVLLLVMTNYYNCHNCDNCHYCYCFIIIIIIIAIIIINLLSLSSENDDHYYYY